MGLFSRQKAIRVVYNYTDACSALKKMGIDIRPRQNPSHLGVSSLIVKDGMTWVFSGDDKIYTVARFIKAPDRWDEREFWSWSARKNFITASYFSGSNSFLLANNIAAEGGVVVENLARVVGSFDLNMKDFLRTMRISTDHLAPLQ